MANLQYVGARYVPKFYENSQDPISPEWESGVGYESFMVVTYLGDSYTSKKPVPATVGTPATNPEYWVRTGSYNAAILNIQSQIDILSDDVTILQKEALNVVELGADNEGNSDNSTLFNSIFNDPQYERKSFYFPSGVYNIGSMVTINNGASIYMAADAVIKATSTMSAMFAFNTEAVSVNHVADPDYINSHRFIKGGIFDAQHLADRCLSLRQYFDTTIDCVAFYNIEIAIDTTTNLGTENLGEGAELLIENCRVQNALGYTNASTGFKVANDNVIDNCFFFNVSNCIILTSGGNSLNNIHGWVNSNTLSLISTFITTSGACNYGNNLYCDDIPCIIRWAGNGYFMISNIRVLLSSLVSGYTGALFDGSASGTFVINNMTISSDNDIAFTDSSHDRYGSIYGFMSQNNNCLPLQPEFINADWNEYTNNNAITTLQNIKSGFYAGSPLGRPSGVGNWFYFMIWKFSGDNYFMLAISTTGHILNRFGKWDDNWYENGTAVSPVTS